MLEHSYGWLSLLPAVTAIVLAIATRRVLPSLLVGVFVGALVIAKWNLIQALPAVFEQHLWPSLIDEQHLRVFAFTLVMGAMVGVMRASGAMEGIVRQIRPLARSRRGGQLTVWLLGLIVFFDDYANSLLLGNTMRPLADRLRISREKLAYLVDSTSAPVAGLALISTWVAGEIGFIREGFEAVSMADSIDGFAVFVETIPYRFYILWALAFVPLVGLLGRDFGSMRRAEERAQRQQHRSEEHSDLSGSWLDALLPIAGVVGVTIWLILATGTAALSEAQERTFWQAFGNGDSYLSLVYGALAGLLIAVSLAWLRRKLTKKQTQEAMLAGVQQVVPALAILWLAWSLSGLTRSEHLDTGGFLAGMLEQSLDPRWMPTVVFVLASAVAFSTGTSWGTMGILMPLVVAVTYRMLSSGGVVVSVHDPLLVCSIASVLAGAIFGDHCSPISDTTVLSSQASGCDHIAHVWTQLPYALTVGAISILCGTLPAGFGVSVFWLLPLGGTVSIVVLLLIGRPVPAPPSASGSNQT